MSRLLLVLLLASAGWPLSAVGDVRGGGQASSLWAAIEQLEAALPPSGLQRLARVGLLPGGDTGLTGRERDGGRPTPDAAADGHSGGGLAPSLGITRRTEDASLDAGVLLLRYDHLPYYATAPPPSR
jgi:hypothetical protein